MTTPAFTPSEIEIRQAVLDFFPPERRGTDTVRRLARCLSAFARATEAGDRHNAWNYLIRWARQGPGETERLRTLVNLLDGSAPVRQVFLDTLERTLAIAEATGLLAESGIPTERGFLPEFTERLMRHLLPAPRNDKDLGQLLTGVYHSETEARGLRDTPPELFHRIVAALCPPERPEMWGPVKAAFGDGFRLLAVRVQALGLERPLRMRSLPTPISQSPFHRQQASAETLLAAWSAGEDTATAATGWHRDAVACRAAMAEIHRRLDSDGVSVDIVYGLEALDRCLSRMALMVEIINEPPGYRRSATIQRLLARLVAFSRQDRSIRHLVRWNLALLNRKIVERSSAVGEHYIAYSRKEYRHIWVAAAGGGLLTAVTAAIKLAVHEFNLPAFPEGMLFGINYAASFLMLGAFGLILATKQPAMTAATLAQMFRDGSKDRLDEVVEFTTRISHSQLAAAISNVAIVSLGAWLIDGIWELVLNRPFLAPEVSAHVIETLSPLNSGTVFYAALTGVVLWLSSMIGGWFDNWSVYHRVPQAIAEHPLGQRLGRNRLQRWAERLRQQAGAWGTSISLGFMLGLVPALGIFFGLPLDVRHVTLSTGMLAMASASLGQRMFEHGFFRGLAGIATMFVLNLGVSFALSLYTATRAYRLDPGEMRELGRRLFRRLRDHPRDFFLAPKTDFVLRTHEGAPEAEPREGP